jgi:hypothetical protein
MNLTWKRRFTDSNSNFDLILQNPTHLDSARLHLLLESIVQETHRGLTLNGRAIEEFRRFFDRPDTPLRSIAYVLLSNWFLTGSGDRNSMVASRCEALWDELFPCRPLKRLSSPVAGKNHIALVSEFQSFWARISKAQGETANPAEPREAPAFHAGDVLKDAPQDASSLVTGGSSEASESTVKAGDRVRATFVKDGLHYQVEGSPSAMADFLDH